jgi:hypothetical protein
MESIRPLWEWDEEEFGCWLEVVGEEYGGSVGGARDLSSISKKKWKGRDFAQATTDELVALVGPELAAVLQGEKQLLMSLYHLAPQSLEGGKPVTFDMESCSNMYSEQGLENAQRILNQNLQKEFHSYPRPVDRKEISRAQLTAFLDSTAAIVAMLETEQQGVPKGEDDSTSESELPSAEVLNLRANPQTRPSAPTEGSADMFDF